MSGDFSSQPMSDIPKSNQYYIDVKGHQISIASPIYGRSEDLYRNAVSALIEKAPIQFWKRDNRIDFGEEGNPLDAFVAEVLSAVATLCATEAGPSTGADGPSQAQIIEEVYARLKSKGLFEAKVQALPPVSGDSTSNEA
jgi:hypothetical protein